MLKFMIKKAMKKLNNGIEKEFLAKIHHSNKRTTAAIIGEISMLNTILNTMDFSNWR